MSERFAFPTAPARSTRRRRSGNVQRSSTMPAIFNALPGLEVPVGGIAKSLAHMWSHPEAAGVTPDASAEVKATQVNFVLHLGYQTTVEDASDQFQTAVRFSRRYPCRVVVLCPMRDDDAAGDMRAKIYGECHPGKTRGDMRCCEFVMLSYPRAARQHLENQVSVCLSTDLPLYYWVHRFSSSARLADYQYLLRRSKRVLFDSAIAPADALTYPWPRAEAVRDLAYSRLLPVRQAIGQFLSGYRPHQLAADLQAVNVIHGEGVSAEARVLAGWVRSRLADCGASQDMLSASLSVRADEAAAAGVVRLAFVYGNKHTFRWTGDLRKGWSQLEACFGGEPSSLRIATHLLSPEAALAEAMFF